MNSVDERLVAEADVVAAEVERAVLLVPYEPGPTLTQPLQ